MMSSASSSSSSRGGKSHSPNSGLMDAQKLLASIALSRPSPFGEIPRRVSQQQRSTRHEGEETLSTRKRPASAHGNGHGSAQILSFATRRPSEPQISTFISPPPTATSSSGMHLHVPMDVKLSASDAFDYDDEWLEGGKRLYAASSSRDGLDSLPLSPSSPSDEWDERLSAASTSQPRSRQATSSRSRESTSPSTPTSSRSSSLHRKPSLLSQVISPPTSSSQCIAVNGRQTITPTQTMVSSSAKGKQSQSLAERGHSVEATMKANMPELYAFSRGRSDRVSPSRRWDRRGASASVLSAAATASALDDENSESTLTTSKIVRKESAGSLEHALFDSDDDGELFQTSDDEDEYNGAEHGEETVLQSSRRSSVDRDRRRELRILLAAPSTSQESTNDANEKMISHSFSTAASGTSEGHGSTDDRSRIVRGSADSQHDKDLQSSNDSMVVNNVDLADDESDGMLSTSAASLLSRRSKNGKKALRSTLKSISPPNRPSLDVIVAGMTPSEERNAMDIKATNEDKKEDDSVTSSFVSRSSAMSSERNSSSIRGISTTSVPVDADSDPLLGRSFGSVADNMQVDAVEWNDNSKAGNGSSTPTLNGDDTITSSRRSSDVRKTVAEQEDERRMGFAAAYQQRLAALSMRLWSNGKSGRSREKSAEASIDSKETASSKSPERGSEAKTTAAPAEANASLFTSSWRHLAMLPNLLLAPALGTASTSHASEGSTANAPKEGEEYSSIAQVIETASSHIAQGSTDAPNDREAALQAAQKAVAHLASNDPKAHPPMLASRTIIAIDRALEEMHQSDIPTSPTTPTSKQDPRKRGGRGVMTPLEADADVSAYVSGLGLPIDPDVELSSVVHLQTFRSDTRARRATSVSRESTSGMPLGVETEKREHKRTFSDSQKQRSPLMQSKIVPPSVPAISEGPSQQSNAEAQFEKMLSNKRCSREPLRDFSSRRAATVRAPKCSRPAVQAPVPGNYSAYNSSASDEDMQSDKEAAKNKRDDRRSRRDGSVRDNDDSRGRGRASAKRSTSPSSQQQCAIGLFSSSSSNVSRSRSGRPGRKSGHSTPTEESASFVLRVRSSPNLSAMKSEEEVKTATSQAEEEEQEEESRRSTKRERDEGKDSGRAGGRRRGRGDGVKRVSASFADGSVTPPRASTTLIRSNSMSDLPLLNAKLIASSVHASSLASNGATVTSVSKSLSTSSNGTSLMSNSHSSSSAADAAVRMPIVGAGNIPHLAGRPSMVSNGAHLLMLSLELEMMRNRKITGSLKPRWLKARMRTEPFGPAAIVAMLAAERQNAAAALSTSESGAETKPDDDTDALTHKPHSHTHPHEHKAHIGLHTAHHSAIHHGPHHNHNQQHKNHHHGKHAIDGSLGYNQPKNRSSLRFELE
ncbi:uncharacterized protein FA14DRAFT_187174 [Meira miltonrushii]|uniref:Uncharacterized protein n=1 Tax=Meira miltonrushii TaxID=1280837 RepID=A0A316VHB8_9BASI|nr:uncharacterized protein FA14DRAFT_187174 [Meira miltonrushii]PWN37039.1 hypothetical protein FA14DRAFT_187174 [Meira miltonrushii]